MKVFIHGKKKSEFTDDVGQIKQFAKLFYSHKAPPDNGSTTYDGDVTAEVSIPFDQYDDIPVGCEAYFDFDGRGKLLDLQLV